MNKKNKKWIIIVILILLSVLCACMILNLTSYHFVKSRAVNYLCDKYDADETDIELLNYKRPHYYFNNDAIPDLTKDYPKWEFKYNNRDFYVYKIDDLYYDDYQLADVEHLCVDWFKKNIDNSICCIDIDSYLIYEYQIEKNNNYLVFNDKNIEELLNSKHARPLNTVYYTSVNKKNKNDELKNKTKQLLPNTGISVFQPIYGNWQIKEQKTKDYILEIYCINQSYE